MSDIAVVGVEKDKVLIPVIDFSHFLHGTASEKQAASANLTNAFQTAGFLYLRNHGIPADTLATVYAQSAAFFRLPKAKKLELAWTTPEANRGYSAPGREKVSQLGGREEVEALRAANPDLKESLEIGREGQVGLENHWPVEVIASDGHGGGEESGKRFKETMLQFSELCKELHVQVMRSIAVGMGLSEAFFDEYTDGGDNTLRLLHYPEVEKDVFERNEGQVRAGEHSDYGSITLLFQDNRGGLQVRSPLNTYVNVPPIEGTVVVNAGDLLARWSNDKIKSTLHRVVEPPVPPASTSYPPRYSIAYFCNPNFEKYIDAIPGTFDKTNVKKYSVINSGDYLVQRLTATY